MLQIQAHKQQRKGFSSFYSWLYIIKGAMKIRCVGVVVVMLIFVTALSIYQAFMQLSTT